jgi:ribosomal protein S21
MELAMPQVIVMNNMESAIRTFKRRVDSDGILREVRSRLESDPKPSVRKKAKARKALKRKTRAAMRRQKNHGERL